MAHAPLAIARDGGIVRLTLDRPDLGNALTNEMATLLGHAIDDIADDPSVRVVVLTGTGALFCAGGDIREFTLAAERLSEHIASGLVDFNRTLLKLCRLPIPVITALNGPVAGGGIGLALSADVVIAAESARFRAGYPAIGLSPDTGTSFHLTRTIGPQRAKEFLFSNRFIGAAEALALGLVFKVVPDAELLPAANALAATFAGFPRGSHAAVKTLVNAAVDTPQAELMALERELMVANAATAESREGIRAFVERRRPAFAEATS
jgi:2-(1,2-epoxy-1,2-dihydrophenyl)acetyl-CoA isomerase